MSLQVDVHGQSQAEAAILELLQRRDLGSGRTREAAYWSETRLTKMQAAGHLQRCMALQEQVGETTQPMLQPVETAKAMGEWSDSFGPDAKYYCNMVAAPDGGCELQQLPLVQGEYADTGVMVVSSTLTGMCWFAFLGEECDAAGLQ